MHRGESSEECLGRQVNCPRDMPCGCQRDSCLPVNNLLCLTLNTREGNPSSKQIIVPNHFHGKLVQRSLQSPEIR